MNSLITTISFLFTLLITMHTASFGRHQIDHSLITVRDTVTWKTLGQLEYFDAPHDIYGSVLLPKFTKDIKALNGKTILIKGYIIPVDNDIYALSQTVYASCFFCGKSGPETVIGLTFAHKPGKLKMDSFVLIKGKFKLNGTDLENWMYSLEEAVIVEKYN